MVACVLLGGKGTLWGPVLGAIIFHVVKETTWTYLLGWQWVALGLILIINIVYFQQGIMGWLQTKYPEMFGIIVAQNGSAPLNEVAIQSSAGSAFNIPIIRVSHIKDSIYFFKANKVCVMACTEKSKNSVKSIDFNKSLAIVLGNENKGISNGVLNLCDEKFKIPISKSLDSYNVSVAAALALYEYFRQNN